MIARLSGERPFMAFRRERCASRPAASCFMRLYDTTADYVIRKNLTLSTAHSVFPFPMILIS